MSATPGRLDVVATPIGNLGDLSARARSALEQASAIAAEDTRHTGQLLASCGISRPMLSLHDYNEAQRSAGLVQRMLAGDVIALVSDAGTPLLSDPGYQLVRAAAAAGIVVRTIPGPSAVTAALSIAGLATDRFVFEGFLPATASARRKALSLLATESRTLVFFEGLSHVGIVRDGYSFYHASTSQGVTRSFYSGYWGDKVIGYRRVPLPKNRPSPTNQEVARR